MILFENDWARYPNAIVDTQTTNESFIRIARLYKHMGIRNHLFPLALLQPELQGVDPHSTTLTVQQKAMISLECQHNLWYFLREVIRVPAKGGRDARRYGAHRGNIAVSWLHMCNIDVANIQIRQTGKSVGADCLMVWNVDFGAQNSLMTLMTKDDMLRKENIRRLKEFRNLLPPYLVIQTSEDADNQIELTNVSRNNYYKTVVAQNNEISANNLGRGITTPILQSDESPFTNYISISLPAALAAGIAAREEAEAAGAPFGNIFTTTAGKKDDRDGKFMYNMIHGGAPWNEIFFDAQDKKHLRVMVEKNGSGMKTMVNVTMNHRQLGKTDQWLYKQIADTGATGEAADRDFFNIWTSGTQSSPLSTELNERIRNSEIEVTFSEICNQDYILRWFIDRDQIIERMSSGSFIMGMDTSEAVGRDAITMVLTDLSDLSTVMVGTFNETNTVAFSYFVGSFLVRFPNVTLIPERKSTGIAIIDGIGLYLIANNIDPFTRIFNRIVDEAGENKNEYAAISRNTSTRHRTFFDERHEKFGFITSGQSRPLLYGSVLQEAAKKAGHAVHDHTLIMEITGLVVKNGRIDHKSSGNDDHVIAWLLNHWFVLYARNIAHYGIDPLSVMRNIGKEGEALTEDDLEERAKIEDTIDKIELLAEELKDATNEFEVLKLEHQIRALSNSIRSQDAQVYDTVAAMIAKMDQDRKQRYSRTNTISTEARSTQYSFRNTQPQHRVEYY